MTRKNLFWVTFLSAVGIATALPNPQRIQLGGTGPRPVLLGAQQQQLAFAGAQQTQPAQDSRIRGQANRPVVLQQGTLGTNGFISGPPVAQPPIGSFPVSPSVRPQQQFIVRSPLAVSTTPAAVGQDDEYEDDEYVDEPVAAVKPQVQPTPKPAVQRGVPVRVQQAQTPVALTQPQRFLIPQAQPQQIQIPVQHRSRQRVAVQQPQAPLSPPAAFVNSVAQHQLRLGQDNRIADDRQTTQKPIQTLNRFMRQNEDGSITWGFESEDGSFKEETLGADCVVRGKYGYVDPDGVRREYEYQTGNPCDPNKRGQEEEEEEVDDPAGQQRLGAILSARPIQLQRRQ